jgi:2-amino-4-hydroxy-6-hydroxymethyldihydropteridine diphosphokinase
MVLSRFQGHKCSRLVPSLLAVRPKYAPRGGSFAVVALGSNTNGAWGVPAQALAMAIHRMPEHGLHVRALSDNFMTRPVGGPWQPDFVNAVAVVEVAMAPAALLRLLKRFEHAAGRRQGTRWGPRPLDLDIIDFGSTAALLARPKRAAVRRQRRAGQLLCPHPEMQRRGFVLVPLAEVAPYWYHPRLKCSVGALLSAPKVKVQLKDLRRMGPA